MCIRAPLTRQSRLPAWPGAQGKILMTGRPRQPLLPAGPPAVQAAGRHRTRCPGLGHRLHAGPLGPVACRGQQRAGQGGWAPQVQWWVGASGALEGTCSCRQTAGRAGRCLVVAARCDTRAAWLVAASWADPAELGPGHSSTCCRLAVPALQALTAAWLRPMATLGGSPVFFVSCPAVQQIGAEGT